MTKEQFRQARQELGMTQAKMADALGVSVLTVIRHEGGSNISQSRAMAVAHLLNTMPRLAAGGSNE